MQGKISSSSSNRTKIQSVYGLFMQKLSFTKTKTYKMWIWFTKKCTISVKIKIKWWFFIFGAPSIYEDFPQTQIKFYKFVKICLSLKIWTTSFFTSRVSLTNKSQKRKQNYTWVCWQKWKIRHSKYSLYLKSPYMFTS